MYCRHCNQQWGGMQCTYYSAITEYTMAAVVFVAVVVAVSEAHLQSTAAAAAAAAAVSYTAMHHTNMHMQAMDSSSTYLQQQQY
jgi:hypothetical protein